MNSTARLQLDGAISLADARINLAEARLMLGQGKDPASVRS
jgi:hypothetical protein